jgi:acyl-[acyl-carrier-protein]-phospholipid O-acyltransferase/long-chain-fatty-acid--[acyl-carrier-protein] ligase
MTTGDKITAIVGPVLPWLVRINPKPSEPGVILFTSGTEGAPKCVALSHSNIIANIEQINAHVTLEPTDIIFNPLPTFHCYGLTAGTLWPVLTGRSLVLHPSPIQVKAIPKRISETGATILLATDTFLQQYSRASDEDGLRSLRLAVCGAERVRDETRDFAEKKFGFEVLEGYGVTEAAPVLAANQPGDIRAGTVGHMLPAIEYRLEPVEGLDGVGRLLVRGPNIMMGYLRVDRPGEIIPPEDGWYDTGDVVSVDENGYISIRDRVKRFAKIGGEMVSLTVVENCASAIWPDHQHAAVTAPDDRKGEQIILVTTSPEADRDRLRTWMQSHGVSNLAVPKRLVLADAIPVLGTGKTDFATVRELAFAEQEDEAPSLNEAEEKSDQMVSEDETSIQSEMPKEQAPPDPEEQPEENEAETPKTDDSSSSL